MQEYYLHFTRQRLCTEDFALGQAGKLPGTKKSKLDLKRQASTPSALPQRWRPKIRPLRLHFLAALWRFYRSESLLNHLGGNTQKFKHYECQDVTLGFTVHLQPWRGTFEESFVWEGLPRSLLQKTAQCLRPFQTKRNASEMMQLNIFKKQESRHT